MSLSFLKDVETIGIIGTAGRYTDGIRLNRAIYDRMFETAKLIIGDRKVELISGGAAWADHIAVRLYLDNPFGHDFIIQLPAPFENGRYVTRPEDNESHINSRISNNYHREFSIRAGIDSLHEIQCAIDKGAKTEVGFGFFDRNERIALADSLIAFTYGKGPTLKDGGTKHAAKIYLARGLNDLTHIDLHDFSIHKDGKV